MAGFSSITGLETIVSADNASFDGSLRGGAMTTNGQLWIGNSALPHVRLGTLTSPLGTLTIGYVSPNITIDLTGSATAIEKIAVDTTTGAGTNPVVPVGGQVTFTGGQYTTGTFGTRVVTINSPAANTVAVDVQISATNAASLMTKNGVSHFNSAQFTVDANGFVGLIGSGVNPPILGVHPNATSGGGTDPTIADGSGNISILAASVAAGSNPIRSVATAANSITVQAQISQAIAATDATKIGLAAFNSGDFSVDANGFVTLIGGGFKWNDQTADLNPIVKENGYFADKASRLVLTLPTTAGMGDTFAISGFGVNGWQVNAGAGQIIKLGSQTTSVAGNLQSTNALDQVEIICSPTTTTFIVRHVLGNITVA